MNFPKVFILGGSSLVGSHFVQATKEHFDCLCPRSNEINILDQKNLVKTLENFSGDVIINFSAYTQVEAAEKQKNNLSELCYQVNALGAKNIAEVCKKLNKHLFHLSTDYVFDGQKKSAAYVETDKPNPINWYGQTKYFGEQFILESGCTATIVRIGMPYSGDHKAKMDIARFFIEQLKNQKTIQAVIDQQISPTYVGDISSALKILIEKKPKDIYHVSSTNSITPYEFARLIAKQYVYAQDLIKPITFSEFNKKKQAKLLENSALDSSKFIKHFGPNYLHTIEAGLKNI